MRRDAIGLAALLALTLGGCASRAKMAGAKATADVKPTRYEQALGHWTRTRKDYNHFETRLIVSATWRNGAFAEAWTDEYARLYLLDDTAREQMRKREESDAQSYQTFFFAAYTPKRDWNDFSKRSSIWNVRLFDDKGNFTEPLVITKVKKDDPVLHAMFPFYDPWNTAYTVKFAKDALAPDTKTLTLRFTSAVGAAELTYDTAGADQPPMERAAVPGAVSVAPAATPTPATAAPPDDAPAAP